MIKRIQNCCRFGYWPLLQCWALCLTGADMFMIEISLMLITLSVIGSWLQSSASLRELPISIWRNCIQAAQAKNPMSNKWWDFFYMQIPPVHTPFHKQTLQWSMTSRRDSKGHIKSLPIVQLALIFAPIKTHCTQICHRSHASVEIFFLRLHCPQKTV